MLTATSLHDDLTRRGIRLVLEGDTMRAIAPAGAITETDRNAIATHKPTLLALLRQQTELGDEHATDNDKRLSDPAHFPAPASCACGASLTIEARQGWEHRYCLAPGHRFDEWLPVDPQHAPLSIVLRQPSPAAGLLTRLDANQTPCCGARWATAKGLRLCLACRDEWTDDDLAALRRLLDSKQSLPVAA